MKRLCWFILMVGVLAPDLAHAQIGLGNSSTVFFATAEEAREVLAVADDFVQRMSPFDRAARMKTDADVSEKEYLKFVGDNILAWSDSEKRKIASAFRAIQARLDAMPLPFPKKVLLIKTTGNEEGQAAYTRANAIVFPKADLAAPLSKIQRTISHELFHIMSRANPELREDCYEAIGFVKGDEVELPMVLKSRKITNPDAPRNDHYIRLHVDGNPVWAIPVLFSSTERYDKKKGGEFFDYLQFQFLLVERHGNLPTVKPVYDDQNPRLVGVQQVSGFMEQIGNNSGYIIHPEEILADNFALMIMGERTVPSPEIITKLDGILKRKRPADLTVPAGADEQHR